MEEQMTTPKRAWPTFKERMDAFLEIVPPALRYSKGAAYMIKSIICTGFPLALDTEVLSVAFKEPDAVLYMQVCREAYYCAKDEHIAIIVKVTDTGWELIFSKFKYSPETNCQYLHTKNYGQPKSLSEAFSDYRAYLYEIKKREWRQQWLDAHPDYDPEPCLKAFKPEPEHYGWLMRLLMKIIPG